MKRESKSFFLGALVGGVVVFILCAALLLTAAWILNRQKAVNGPAPKFCPAVGDTTVTQLFKPIRQKFNVPAMAVAMVTSDDIKFAGAVGVRKRGTEISIALIPGAPISTTLAYKSLKGSSFAIVPRVPCCWINFATRPVQPV